MSYDPEKHHRRSIRLKGHDYAGGGVYFVTLCAHREFIVATGGKPFVAMRDLVEERMRITAEKCPHMAWGEYVIMPDHFHAIIRIRKGGHLSLGDIICGFKAALLREWRRRIKSEAGLGGEAGREGEAGLGGEAGREGEAGLGGEAGLARAGGSHSALHKGIRIWHRNYYEMIVRSAEAEKKIAEYIRMNPWRCVMDFGNGLRGMGNPALWNLPTLAICCSRNAPRPKAIPKAEAYFGGFHSPMEREILAKLLELGKPVIHCPAWGLGGTLPAELLAALESNRALILEMKNRDGDLAAAEQRNRFVLEHADRLWLPHVTPGGMLSRLVCELNIEEKMIR